VDAGQAKQLLDELSRLIVGYLDTKTSEAATWRVSCDLADRHLALLAAATSPPVVQGGQAPWTGRQRFVVAFDTRDGAVHLPIYAEVTTTSKPVVVAVEPLSRGEVITAAHLELRAVDFLPKAAGRRTPVESLEGLIGMEARQAIQAGAVVFSDQVQSPVLIKRGEVISVSSHAGGIRVRTTARARQDGAKGDVVQVESLETRERFDARVVGVGEAALIAPTPRDKARTCAKRPSSRKPALTWRNDRRRGSNLAQRREGAKRTTKALNWDEYRVVSQKLRGRTSGLCAFAPLRETSAVHLFCHGVRLHRPARFSRRRTGCQFVARADIAAASGAAQARQQLVHVSQAAAGGGVSRAADQRHRDGAGGLPLEHD
jgi:flagella basal body P-ring formation protein FlgA